MRMRNVLEYAEQYKDAPYSSDSIKQYLEDHAPTGSYQGVLLTFQTEGSKGTKEDIRFYHWMKENYKNLTTLRPLMELMDTKDFCDFVFLFGNMENPFHNQKWHFYVSYLAFREFATLSEGVSATKYRKEDDKYLTGAFHFNCPELIMWYNEYRQ